MPEQGRKRDPGLACREAGKRLRDELPELLRTWEARVLQSTSPAGPAESGQRLPGLDFFFSEVVAALESGCRPGDAWDAGPVEEHARQRSRVPGYTVDRLLREYQLAREVLLEALEREGPLETGTRSILDGAVDRALRAAAAAFQVERERAVQAQVRDYRLLVECTQDYGVITLDPEGRITTWSPGAEKIAGFTAAEAVGRHFRIIFTEEDRAAGVPEQELRTALEDGRAPDERWHQREDGSRYFASGVTVALRDGQVRGFAKVMRDATQRKEAEMARDLLLRQQEVARSKAERAVEQLHSLQSVTDIALTHLALDDLLRELLRRIQEALCVDTVAILLLDGDELAVRATRGLEEEVERAGRIRIGEGFAGRVFAEGRPLIVDDVEQIELVSPVLREKGIRSLLGVPLRAGDDVLGVIHVGCFETSHFGEEVVRLLELVAHRAALAIERTRLYHQIERRNAHLQLLSEVAAQLHLSDRPEEFVQRVYARLAEHLGLDFYASFLVDEDRRRLRLVSCLGVPEAEIPEISFLEFGEAVCGTVAATREPSVASRVQEEPREATAVIRALGIRAYACFPLIAIDHLIGTLSFGSRVRESFEPDELSLMKVVADQAAVAMERARLSTALQERADALVEADRRKDEFLATLAHELRNPLAGISNATYLLERLRIDDPQRERLRSVVRRQTEHLTRMVDDLLDLSRITHQKIELRREPVDLVAVLHQAVETTRPFFHSRKHHLHGSLPVEGIRVLGDPTRLEQVFANLLNNAAKYTPPEGEIFLEVAVTEGPEAALRGEPPQGSEAGAVVVRLRDTGVGIPAGLLPRVFDMFTQAEQTLERPAGGLGIGLALARRLVELHGGTIEARSEGPGHGSEFIVTLPLLREDAAPAGPARRPPHPTLPSTMRVLVVEDNPDAAETLAEILRLWGVQFQTVETGLAALEVFPDLRPHAVLLDIGLPGMDGYEVARRLCSAGDAGDSLEQGSPILVALTGYGQNEDRRRSRDAGFDHHLVKPIDPEELHRLLSRLNV